ncbi:MAG TPA: hypothetical protein VGI20_13885 [Rhizomicrobium sp.]|jgi:uncharacterized membrane protein
MRSTGLGRILFALSFAALGALSLGFHDFAAVWPIEPKWVPWHDTVATFFAAILLAGGLALLVPRAARPASLVLACLFLLRELVWKIPNVAAHPLVELRWYDVSESLTFLAGAWTIFSMSPRKGAARADFGNVRVGQILFGLALPAIGLSHFFYLNFTTPLIPSWLPFHVQLAYFTGAAHIAAGLGILSGVLPRLAATLEAVMVSLFTLLVWVPVVISAPANLSNWSEICVSIAVAGTAWAVAESFRSKSWGLARAR